MSKQHNPSKDPIVVILQQAYRRGRQILAEREKAQRAGQQSNPPQKGSTAPKENK